MPAKVDRCANGLIKRKVQQFIEKYGRSPSRKRRREIEESAWRVCYWQYKKRGDSVKEGGSY